MVGVSEETVTVTLPLDLAREFADRWGVRMGDGPVIRTAQAVLAALPKPKPEEPTGLGAVVRDRDGHAWVRIAAIAKFPWRAVGAGICDDWSDLDVPDESHILSRGWSA